MKTNEIADIIIKDLCRRGFPYFLTTYQGQGMDEADVFAVNRSGYMYEFEIKRSRADFQAEFRNKQHKHDKLRLRDAVRVYNLWVKGKKTNETYQSIIIPNRYYFICPEGLIKPEEIPEYAGLIYVGEKWQFPNEIKKAKLLHRNKANIQIYKRIATILSQRIIYGCSFYTHRLKNN